MASHNVDASVPPSTRTRNAIAVGEMHDRRASSAMRCAERACACQMEHPDPGSCWWRQQQELDHEGWRIRSDARAQLPIEERTRRSPIRPSTRRSASIASRRPSKRPGVSARKRNLNRARANARRPRPPTCARYARCEVARQSGHDRAPTSPAPSRARSPSSSPTCLCTRPLG
jgi:hypothetical protein